MSTPKTKNVTTRRLGKSLVITRAGKRIGSVDTVRNHVLIARNHCKIVAVPPTEQTGVYRVLASVAR